MERDLVIRAQRGDEEAYADLVALVGGRLHAVARRILRDLDLADDATQRALVSIWRDLPQLRDPATFEGWAYRVLVRACYAEGKRSRAAVANLRILERPPEVDVDPSGLVIARDELERGFRRLSLEHRAVIVLHYYADLPLDRVAEVLGIPPGTVRSRLHLALRGLRAALDADARTTTRGVAT
jgi:RNA polymerase sigma-70 factor (ECF subfamily)